MSDGLIDGICVAWLYDKIISLSEVNSNLHDYIETHFREEINAKYRELRENKNIIKQEADND